MYRSKKRVNRKRLRMKCPWIHCVPRDISKNYSMEPLIVLKFCWLLHLFVARNQNLNFIAQISQKLHGCVTFGFHYTLTKQKHFFLQNTLKYFPNLLLLLRCISWSIQSDFDNFRNRRRQQIFCQYFMKHVFLHF